MTSRLSLFKAQQLVYNRTAVTESVLTLFAGSEETHDGRVDVSGCGVTRSCGVHLWQYVLVAQDGPDRSLEGQI